MPQHGDIDDDSLKQNFEKDIARDGLTFVRYNEKTKVGLVRGFAKPDSTPRRSLSDHALQRCDDRRQAIRSISGMPQLHRLAFSGNCIAPSLLLSLLGTAHG